VCRVPFSCFAHPDSLSVVLRASGTVFGFCAPYSFSVVPRTLGPIFLFCTPGLVFCDTDGVRSRFDVLRNRTCFRQYRGCRVPFTCYARPDSFSAVSRASCPVFIFYAPGLVFGGTGGVGSRFHVVRGRARFRRYRRRRVLFSSIALPDSFSAIPGASGHVFIFVRPDSISLVPRASGLIFMFCALGIVVGGTEDGGSCFMFCAPGPFFVFCAPRLVFGGNKGVGSHFYVLRVQTHFRLYRGRRVPFSCFALPDSFSAVSSVSGPAFMFCALGLFFGRIEGVVSYFHV
jgi:hypothetical protein